MGAMKKVLENPLTLLMLVLVWSLGHSPLLAADVSDVTPSFNMSSLWLPALILGIGIALILLEVFVLPGFGISGISGILASVVGLFLGTHTLISQGGHFSDAMGYVLSSGITAVLATMLGCIMFWALPRLPGFRSMLPKDALPGELRGEAVEALHHLTGQPGIAKTALRPAGKIALENGQLIDVVTRGEFIEAGTQVYVVKVEGPSVVVSKLA
ncbi:MAG: hypothetical protein HUU03_00825 [Planctomycetaceae bacterium]|nr:hypothetical protein [Planctomycetota bacterium]MCQ3948215.1 hypothetical protein [Planctomycetota bacterium]NUO14963.1 hypothetical protein [Planctomycetaceae bacterium]GIK52894.1 MAG: hypothetical protein BroJett014_18670 [Planctomycetota bacterium]HRJ76984.1 NfeD family protein [Planctomycetota bacterium]